MRKPAFITGRQAVDLIEDGSTLGIIAMTQISACETILKELEKKFLEEGHPKDLTYFHSCGQASAKLPGGMQHLAHEGLLKRVYGGHWGQSEAMMELISGNKIEAFNLPQGQMANIMAPALNRFCIVLENKSKKNSIVNFLSFRIFDFFGLETRRFSCHLAFVPLYCLHLKKEKK